MHYVVFHDVVMFYVISIMIYVKYEQHKFPD